MLKYQESVTGNMEQKTEWTSACSESVKHYDELLKKGQTDKPLNVYAYLKWLNESDTTVMDYLPKRSK